MSNFFPIHVNEGTAANTPIPNFVSMGVTVDNLSSSWLFLPDIARSVPPWTASWSSPIPQGTKNAACQWQTPTGVTVPTAGAGMATLTFVDITIPYNPGVVVTQAQPTVGGSPASIIVQPSHITSIPGIMVTPVNVQPAPGATSALVAAKAGQTITLYGGYIGFTPNATVVGAYAGFLEDGTTTLIRFRGDLSATGYVPPVPWPLAELSGYTLAKGNALQVTNDAGSAGAVTYSGYILFTQS